MPLRLGFLSRKQHYKGLWWLASCHLEEMTGSGLTRLFCLLYISKEQQKKSNRINIDICDRKQLCACKVTACPWNGSQSHHEPQSCFFLTAQDYNLGERFALYERQNVCLHIDTQVHYRFTCFSQLWLLRLTYMHRFLSFSLFTVSSCAMDVPEPVSLA